MRLAKVFWLGLVEKLVFFVMIGVSVVIVVVGVIFAFEFKDPYWVKRSGAAVVGVEAFCVLFERWRQRRLREAERFVKVRDRDDFHRMSEKKEHEVIVLGVSLAVVGEALHGFGDLFFLAVWGEFED